MFNAAFRWCGGQVYLSTWTRDKKAAEIVKLLCLWLEKAQAMIDSHGGGDGDEKHVHYIPTLSLLLSSYGVVIDYYYEVV